MIDPTPSQTTEIVEAAAVAQPQPDYDVTREVGYYQLVWRRLRRHRMAMISAGVLVFLTLASFIVPNILSSLAPTVFSDTPDLLHRFGAPAWPHIMGTDELGRDIFRRILRVAPAVWRDPLELAQPTAAGVPATLESAGIAYSNSKLAILYYAHELQRRAPAGVNVTVYEPGFMPGTGLSRPCSSW